MITLCDNYFSLHIAKEEYFSFDSEMRMRAIAAAKIDLASCGAGGITENSPELLRTALFEQTLFVLNSKDKYSGSRPEVISESVEGVGTCRYAQDKCPSYISRRAFSLVSAYFRAGGNIRITRG